MDLDPAYVHAFDVLGYLVTEDNADRFTAEELEAWDREVDAWRAAHPEELEG